jgi:predicted DNA-binding transcriptional regulator AlpA
MSLAPFRPEDNSSTPISPDVPTAGTMVAEGRSDNTTEDASTDNRPEAGPAQPGPLLLTAKQSAALSTVSLATWWRWDAARECPAAFVRKGQVVRWRRDELLAWIDAGMPDRKEWEARCRARKGGRR